MTVTVGQRALWPQQSGVLGGGHADAADGDQGQIWSLCCAYVVPAVRS